MKKYFMSLWLGIFLSNVTNANVVECTDYWAQKIQQETVKSLTDKSGYHKCLAKLMIEHYEICLREGVEYSVHSYNRVKDQRCKRPN